MSGTPGFDRAPVSRGLFVVTVFSSVVYLILSSSLSLSQHSQLPLSLSTFSSGEVWRLLTNFLIFENTHTLIIAAILLYNLCILHERLLGSHKLAGGLFYFFLSNLVLDVIVLVIYYFSSSSSSLSFSPLASGPWFLFGFFPSFYLHVPALINISLFNCIPLSDKSFTYLLGIQLLASSLPETHSLTSAAIALCTGILWIVPCFHFDGVRVPSFLGRGFEFVHDLFVSMIYALHRFIFERDSVYRRDRDRDRAGAIGGGGYVLGSASASASASASSSASASGYRQVQSDYDEGVSMLPLPVFDSSSSSSSSSSSVTHDHVDNGSIADTHNSPFLPSTAPVGVDGVALRELVSMGFNETSARQALIDTNNNIETATLLLVK